MKTTYGDIIKVGRHMYDDIEVLLLASQVGDDCCNKQSMVKPVLSSHPLKAQKVAV